MAKLIAVRSTLGAAHALTGTGRLAAATLIAQVVDGASAGPAKWSGLARAATAEPALVPLFAGGRLRTGLASSSGTSENSE